MKKLTAFLVAAALAAAPLAAAAQQRITPESEAAAMKQLAAAIPAGSRVKLETTAGRKLTGTLVVATDAGIILKRESRVPEPAVTIAYTDLARLHREAKSGFSVGKAIGVGLAAGAGAILTLFAIMVSISD